MKNSNPEEKYMLHAAGGFFVLILIGILISALRVNFYM